MDVSQAPDTAGGSARSAGIEPWLQARFALRLDSVAPVVGGLDAAASCLRLRTVDGGTFLLRLRNGPPNVASHAVPRWLHDAGVSQVVAPIRDRHGALCSALDGTTATLFPFVDGTDGYERRMTDDLWHAVAVALRAIHGMRLVPGLLDGVSRSEPSVAPYRRLRVVDRELGPRPEGDAAAEFAGVWREHRAALLALLGVMDRLAPVLRTSAVPPVVCHGDLHPGNILIDGAGGVHLIDWDDVMLALPERDLIFVPDGRKREAPLLTRFLDAYEPAREIDPAALAYYRCERVIQDALSFANDARRGPVEAVEAARWLRHVFAPGGEAAAAEAAVRRSAMPSVR